MHYLCDDLNENDSYGCIYLNACFLIGGTVLERIRRCGHIGGGVSLGLGPVFLCL